MFNNSNSLLLKLLELLLGEQKVYFIRKMKFIWMWLRM